MSKKKMSKEMRAALDNVEGGLSDLIDAKKLIPGDEWIKKAREAFEDGASVRFLEEFVVEFPQDWARYDERMRSLPGKLRADMNVLLFYMREEAKTQGGVSVPDFKPTEDREGQEEDVEDVR